MSWSRPPIPASKLARGALCCLQRYGCQALAASGATLVSSWLVSSWTSEPTLISLCATACESCAFYGVALAREPAERGLRAALRALLREYGRAEAADLALRPVLMTLGQYAAPHAVVGVMLGSYVADALFYAQAMHAKGTAATADSEIDPG